MTSARSRARRARRVIRSGAPGPAPIRETNGGARGDESGWGMGNPPGRRTGVGAATTGRNPHGWEGLGDGIEGVHGGLLPGPSRSDAIRLRLPVPDSSASFRRKRRGELAPAQRCRRLPRFQRARPSTFLDSALWNWQRTRYKFILIFITERVKNKFSERRTLSGRGSRWEWGFRR